MSTREEPVIGMTSRRSDARSNGVADSPEPPMEGFSQASSTAAELQSLDQTQMHNLSDTSYLSGSSDDESRTLDFESNVGSNHTDSLTLDVKPDDMSDGEKAAEIIGLARRIAVLGVPASIDGALLLEVDFLVDSAIRVLDIVGERGGQGIDSARSSSIEL